MEKIQFCRCIHTLRLGEMGRHVCAYEVYMYMCVHIQECMSICILEYVLYA